MLAVLLVAACIASTLPASAATSTSTVGATVLSSVSVNPNGCRSGIAGSTSLGSLTSGTGVVGSVDCSVAFGSSNDTARLEVSQGDGTGTVLSNVQTTDVNGINRRLATMALGGS